MNGIGVFMVDTENCIVSSIRMAHNPADNIYTVISGAAMQLKSETQLELYDRVSVQGESAIFIGHEDQKSKKAYARMFDSLLKKADTISNSKNLGLKDEYSATARKMLPSLVDSAKTFLKAFLSSAPIVVRFHNDGDGSAGAIALHRAVSALEEKGLCMNERSISWQMNKGIAYTMESFYTDRMLFGLYKSAEKPLVLITDFGTSPESEEAIKLAEGVCDIIWLDHHIPYAAFPREKIRHYINVFDFGGDSNFTAGLETCIFAELLSGIDAKVLKGASLISDYSAYADFKDKEALRVALILDFLTSTGDSNYSKPKQMDLILNDREKSESTFRQASNSLDEAINAGIRNIRRCKGSDGVNICVLDFGHVAKLDLGYPLPGRYSSKLQNHLETENNGNTITIVHYGNYISMRISKDLSGSVNLLEIIERLKVATNGELSGGGHQQAASIKTTSEHMNDTMRMLLVELGVKSQAF